MKYTISITVVLCVFFAACSPLKFRNKELTVEKGCGMEAINQEIAFAKEKTLDAMGKKFGTIANSFIMIPKISFVLKGLISKQDIENHNFINHMQITKSPANSSITLYVKVIDFYEGKQYTYNPKSKALYTYRDMRQMNASYYFYTTLLLYRPKCLLECRYVHCPSILLTENDELLFFTGEPDTGKLEFYSIDDFVEKYNDYYKKYVLPQENSFFSPDDDYKCK